MGAHRAADLPPPVAGKICLVDGTLVPTLNWRHRQDLFNTHRRYYGINVQLLVDLHEDLTVITVSPSTLGSLA